MVLTEKYRPQTIDDVIGQEIVKETLRHMMAHDNLKSCIFYGPPGCGKTSLAKALARECGFPFILLDATKAKIDDVRKAANNREDKTKPVLVYLDEIQYFNKKQQQTLLSYVEEQEIILIAATTDNPYHSCEDALISRCIIMQFKPVKTEDVAAKLLTIADKEQRVLTQEAATILAELTMGDVRRAINLLDMAFIQTQDITKESLEATLPNIMSVNMSSFDTNHDAHYALIAALQKSIRGSDPNAAVFYLARLLEGGDIESPSRRMLVMAHEDIGLGNPDAAAYVLACVQTAERLGLPEAKLPLTNAAIMLAISPKCNTSGATYGRAAEDIAAGKGSVVPAHINKEYPRGYLYPHNYPHHWVRQQYMPDDLVGHIYYTPGDNKFEQEMAAYWSRIMC